MRGLDVPNHTTPKDGACDTISRRGVEMECGLGKKAEDKSVTESYPKNKMSGAP